MSTPAPSTRPNILVFLTDDHGQWASSAYGNREVRTPVMQWLSDTGARMHRAFCTQPVCSPARASFWTGRIPSNHGVLDFLGEPNENPEHPGIVGMTNLGELLQRAGYRTGMVGKWHAGDYWYAQPGFDTWFTSGLGTRAWRGHHEFYEKTSDGSTVKVSWEGHQHTAYTDKAVSFLREHATATQGQTEEEQQPFFLFVGYTNTHTPHTGESAPLVHQYSGSQFGDIPREKPLDVHGHRRIEAFDPDETERREDLAEYYAAIDEIDRQMLRLIEELENTGRLDNTLIVYTGDHGHMNGHHGQHTKCNSTIPANFLEESILIPALLRLPGVVKPGSVPTAPVDQCDLFATLLDVAGMDLKAVREEIPTPGKSFLPLLQGEAIPWKTHQIVEAATNRMIRTESGKLIRRYPNKLGDLYPDAFFDLREDPRETENRIDNPRYAETIAELDALMQAHFDTYADPAREGINMETILKHNACDPWLRRPGSDDHRQS